MNFGYKKVFYSFDAYTSSLQGQGLLIISQMATGVLRDVIKLWKNVFCNRVETSNTAVLSEEEP